MRVTIKLFGPQAQAAGQRSVELDLPGPAATCTELRERLSEACPALAATLPGCRVAVNHEFATEGTRIKAGDEVALIGQVSGG